jgi:hypothetical protein
MIPLLDVEKLLTLDIPEFVIEDANIWNLDTGIKKKFTSLSKSPVTYTTIYDPTIFRWKFGDEKDPNAYTETINKEIYHTYKKPGIYMVQHQACNFCTCSGWGLCWQSINVQPIELGMSPILLGGILAGFIYIAYKKKCEDYDNEKHCERSKDCRWLTVTQKCAKIKK